MKKEKYLITTAIAYSSAIPHIGNVYEIILSDAVARFKRLDGFDVWFQTGTDDHGQKIAENAARNELSPKAYVDFISGEIKRIYDSVNISYDSFVRTTDRRHIETVQSILQTLYDSGDVYLGKYEGWYSVADESYIKETDIVDGRGPSGDKLIWMSEESYFLKLGKYQERLTKYIEENESFIAPETRRNETLLNFLKEPLYDLSISRTSFDWGIKLPFNDKHVTYVWVDALSNYISGLDYNPTLASQPLAFTKFWPADVQIVGKDVLRFHSVYWPIILFALGLPLPKQVFAHPWILFDKGKMSKSVGNVMYTDDLLKHFPVDLIRYYVLHQIPYASDGNITYELLIEKNNSDLANTIGNLVNRTIGMVNKYRDGLVTKTLIKEPFEYSLAEVSVQALPKIRILIEELRVADGLEEIMKLARLANKYIDVSEPWNLFKDPAKKETLDYVLYSLVETIRFIAGLLQPFLPATAQEILKQLDYDLASFESLKAFGAYPTQKIGEAKVIFERYDLKVKLDEVIGVDK